MLLIHLTLPLLAVASSNTPANIMNSFDFLKAEITTMDYTDQICSKNVGAGELPECVLCFKKNTCSVSMVGFESRVARVNPADDLLPTATTTVLMAAFIGAPTLIVSSCPSFLVMLILIPPL